MWKAVWQKYLRYLRGLPVIQTIPLSSCKTKESGMMYDWYRGWISIPDHAIPYIEGLEQPVMWMWTEPAQKQQTRSNQYHQGIS